MLTHCLSQPSIFTRLHPPATGHRLLAPPPRDADFALARAAARTRALAYHVQQKVDEVTKPLPSLSEVMQLEAARKQPIVRRPSIKKGTEATHTGSTVVHEAVNHIENSLSHVAPEHKLDHATKTRSREASSRHAGERHRKIRA